MKIAVFYNLAFGGAKRVVFDQVKYLTQNGHIVDVFTTDSLHDAFDMEQVAHHTYRYDFVSPHTPLSFINQFLEDFTIVLLLKKTHKQIAQDIDEKKYDVVLVHPDRFTQAPYLLRFLKTRSAYYCQEPLRIVYEYGMRFQNSPTKLHTFYEMGRRTLRKKIDVENVRAATATIASCYHIRERMIEAYDVLPFVVYAGIDIHTFHPVRLKKEQKVFFVGSKDESTDGYILAKKAIDLIPVSSRPELVVISWRKENGERLHDEELVRMYAQSCVTLCVSTFETFGLVPLESMACGTSVIATRISGHRETVKEESGFLVEPDPVEIKAKIEFFLDKTNAQNYGNKARVYVEKEWSWEKKIQDLEKTLKKVSSL